MACCERVGGNWSPAKAAKVVENVPGSFPAVQYIDAQPYHITELNFRNAMPIPFLAAAGAGLQLAKNSAIARAESGQEVTPAKTVVGKFIGGFTGRNEAAQISQSMKTASGNAAVSPATSKTLARQGVPISGDLQFGKAGSDRNFLLAAISIAGGVLLGVVYFLNPKKKRRR